MAIPRAFISSTIYDLGPERAAIQEVLESRGFEPILSEQAETIQVDPHARDTYENCLRQVEGCSLLILVLSKRLGSSRSIPWDKTIVYREFLAATKKGVPVYVFKDHDVTVFEGIRRNTPPDVTKALGDSFDFRVLELLDSISKLLGPTGAYQANHWILTYHSPQELSGILKTQLSHLLGDGLSALAITSKLGRSNYRPSPLSLEKNSAGKGFITVKLLNDGPSAIYDVHARFYVTFRTDIGTWHELPCGRNPVAPRIQPDGPYWRWVYALDEIDRNTSCGPLPDSWVKSVVSFIFDEEQNSMRTLYLAKNEIDLLDRTITRENVEFRLVCNFTVAMTSKRHSTQWAWNLCDLDSPRQDL